MLLFTAVQPLCIKPAGKTVRRCKNSSLCEKTRRLLMLSKTACTL